LGPEALIVVIVVLLAIVVLATTQAPADAVLVAALFLLILLPVPSRDGFRMGVLTVEQVTAGFVNTGLLTVGVLFGVVTGLRNTGAIDWVAQSALGRPRSLSRALVRMVFPVAGLSAFINNTPLVAIMLPPCTTGPGGCKSSLPS
jgi:Na+/H+ antiporter NhaD/arsenite permease-like protein